MGRRYISLGKVGVLTNRDVRDSVKPLVHAEPPQPRLQSQDSSRKRPLESSNEPATEELQANRTRNKKLKMALYGMDDEVYNSQEKMGDQLAKYWHQRYRLWKRFDEGIKMDREGWWSVTPEDVALHTAERLRCDTVVDAFCGCGGNSIQLAMTCQRVIATDNNAFRLACASHNAQVYGVADRITFILADFTQWAHQRALDSSAPSVDAVFLSPPWGGLDYLLPGQEYSLDQLLPLPGQDLYQIARKLSENVAMFVPRNTSVEEMGALAQGQEKEVEVEEVYMSGKLKALTAYFGDLASRQS